MTISNTTLIEDRRIAVRYLSARGLNSKEITEKLKGKFDIGWTDRTIRNDLEWIRQQRGRELEAHRKDLGEAYAVIKDNYGLLRKELWDIHEKATTSGDNKLRLDCVDKLLKLNYQELEILESGSGVEWEVHEKKLELSQLQQQKQRLEKRVELQQQQIESMENFHRLDPEQEEEEDQDQELRRNDPNALF